MAKKAFKKFGHEDIRTDFYAFSDSQNAPAEIQTAGTLVKFNEGGTAVEASDSDLSGINKTTFLLAEDLKPEDNGFVYYIVEHVENLEDRA